MYVDGQPCPDRQWVECYAQLIGTVLSLWNAAALDAAGEGEEVPPTFINLADASIKMVSQVRRLWDEGLSADGTRSRHYLPKANTRSH